MIILNEISKSISSDFKLTINNLILKNGVNYRVFGKNGSGKTLFLKLVLGITAKDSGIIKKENTSLSGFLGIERMIDFLTPKEYFYIVCKSYGIPKSKVLERFNSINKFFNRKYMDEKKLICDYSDGNKQLIGIIAACLPFTDFVLLDEPFNYLDTETVTSLVSMLNQLNKENGISFVYSDNTDRIKLEHFESIIVENGNITA